MTENSAPKRSVETWLQIGGLIVAVVTIPVTAYLSLRLERNKEITVKVLATRPLVSVEAGRSRVGLEVRIGEKRVDAPWLLSAKLENTGNLAIEERDIEAPV